MSCGLVFEVVCVFGVGVEGDKEDLEDGDLVFWDVWGKRKSVEGGGFLFSGGIVNVNGLIWC